MSASWDRLLADTAKPLHDLAQSPTTRGIAEIALGIATVGAGIALGPEVALGEAGEVGIGALWRGVTIASHTLSGTAAIVGGGVEAITGQDPGVDAAKDPFGITSGMEIANDIKDTFTGPEALDRLLAIRDIFEKTVDHLLNGKDSPQKDATSVENSGRQDRTSKEDADGTESSAQPPVTP